MAAAFSYAEAAKGLTPSASISQTEKAPDQATLETATETMTLSVNEKPSDIATPAGESIAAALTSVGNHAQAGVPTEQESNDISNTVTSGHASPSFGGDSTATLLKDDDTSGNLHDGSDSTTWEKVSQDSHADDKTPKVDGESDDSKLGAWEKVSSQSLKDAPPPAVNPWTKRAQIMQAKVTSPIATESNSFPKAPIEMSGPGGKKKSRTATSEGGTLRPEKVGEGKARNGEAPLRRYKPASETRAASHLPPPASDAISWPTPDDAASSKPEERRRSITDRSETTETEQNKSSGVKHGRKEWVSIPFVPTPVFNTPLPNGRRGGKPGARGGRDGGSGRGPAGGSTPSQADRSPSTQRGDVSIDGSRADVAASRQTGANRQKRMSSAGLPRPRDFRKGEEGHEERPAKAFDHDSGYAGDLSRDDRRLGPGADTSETTRRQMSLGAAKSPVSNGAGGDATSPSFDSNSRGSERRLDSTQGGRESGAPRETRVDRGGRSFRGRGGHGVVSGHQSHFQNGMNYQYGHAFSPSKGVAMDQRQGSQSGRHLRSGSRTQPGPHQQFVPRYGMSPAMGMGFPPMSPEMTAGYGFVPGVAPHFYHPYQDQQGLVGMIMEQMRYWFSLDNLIRDLYLRKRMDDNGFVPLSFLMPWKRMQQLTSDVKMVRFACQNVPQIELRVDKDGNEYVRKAEEWEKWIFPLDERHEQARKEGAPQLFPVFPNADSSQQSQNLPQQKSAPKPSPPRMANGSPSHRSASGLDDGPNGTADAASGNQTPLSATVPEFKPEGLLAAKVTENTGGEDMFHESQVDDLAIVVRNPHVQTRTMPIQQRSQVADLQADSENVESVEQNSRKSSRPIAQNLEVERYSDFVVAGKHLLQSCDIFWELNTSFSKLELPSDMTKESYAAFKSRALSKRDRAPQGHCPVEMIALFAFWSQFLAHNFNSKMYCEFRGFAVDDFHQKYTSTGMDNLLSFYRRKLLCDECITDRIIIDFIGVVQVESGSDQRPALRCLEELWNNLSTFSRNKTRLRNFTDRQLLDHLDDLQSSSVS